MLKTQNKLNGKKPAYLTIPFLTQNQTRASLGGQASTSTSNTLRLRSHGASTAIR